MDKKNRVQRIFDSISPKYDLLNHLLSAGIDFYWRKKALKLTKIDKNAKLLDVACGTGDFAIAAKKRGVKNITGADLSINMLKIFSEKTGDIKGRTVQCVAEHLPFKDESFTNITVAFGVRNFYDILEGFKSFNRVLCKGGKATIVEFRMPTNFFIKAIYTFYFTKILPLVGRIISKDPEAYTYLPESVQDFDKKINLPSLLKEAGFNSVEYKALTFGIVQVVIGEK
ncbi:MAG: bifunctional demethylmenaquinone methyltransferase/2-methoxy-6-polyprenyl-1,4-benzoquinol methylase UbiE [Ignavibacteria bacterium]|nr:MAG: bifunctional demethylmenaquinone methyltransferase/2-methoxy-6-polyprenyl-1,4-benzoquinol methylase UbiE [Ignavibacteria bacterium]